MRLSLVAVSGSWVWRDQWRPRLSGDGSRPWLQRDIEAELSRFAGVGSSWAQQRPDQQCAEDEYEGCREQQLHRVGCANVRG